MVDVSAKPATERIAVAEGRVVMSKATLELIVCRQRQEGRRAGHRAHRRHHGGETHLGSDSAVPSAGAVEGHARHPPDKKLPGCIVRATVKVTGPTGVEMEALTAVSVACLTIYDMIKAVERGVRIEGIHLVEKKGRQIRALSRLRRLSRRRDARR